MRFVVDFVLILLCGEWYGPVRICGEILVLVVLCCLKKSEVLITAPREGSSLSRRRPPSAVSINRHMLLIVSHAILTLVLLPSPAARCAAPRCCAAKQEEQALLQACEQAASFCDLTSLAPVTSLALERAGKEGAKIKRAKSGERAAIALRERIEMAATSLEDSQPTLSAAKGGLDVATGAWRLLYSDAPEITNLVKLPLGLKLRSVHQRVDVERGILENRADVGHVLRLAKQQTRVVARLWADELGAVSRAGVTNEGNRVAVQFTKVVIQLRRLLFIPTPFLKVVAKPNGTLEKEGRVPTLDVTYVSDALRVSRGGDGSLFVLERAADEGFGELEEPGEDVVESKKGFDGVTGKVENV